MDAIEIARRRAAELHANLVAAGADPFAPLALVLAEANRREIDVEPTQPGGNALQGGRARFKPADRLILYEDKGTDFIKAFLIAHELGHVDLGDDVQTCEIDPLRPSEAAPVGTERVVDHNRRKRREIQMDLFARELLVPREWVRRLFLDKKSSAAAIAKQLGAPYEIIAQQLFDALLLPSVPDDQELRPTTDPNDDQRAAIIHRGAPYLLTAGPGTGKTQTLTARIASLLAEKDTDPRSLLVLTYSNKAAGEMSDRIAADDPGAAAAMWMGTFHAFGLDILRRFGDRIGIDPAFQMLDRAAQVELLEDEFPRLGLVHYRNLFDPANVISDILNAISRAKDETCDANDYAGHVKAAKREARPGSEEEQAAAAAEEIARVYARYEELKGPRRVDFGDLVMLPVKLLEKDAEVRDHFTKTYTHVLVDEYQDVNRASVRLLQLLRPNGENLWAVGDLRQSIYRFRGASSHNMRLFKEQDFPTAEERRLAINYRSRKEIVDTFVAFAGEMRAGKGTDRDLEADRGKCGHKPELRTTDQPGMTSALIAQAIAEQGKAGTRFRDQAVLCTGNDRLARIGRELEALNIPVLYLGSLFERPEIKNLLALLHLLADPRGVALARVSTLPGFEMALSDLAPAIEALRAETQLPPRWLSTVPVASVTPGAAQAMTAIATMLRDFDADSDPWRVLTSILLDRSEIVRKLAASDSVQDRSSMIAIWQFMNFLRAQPAGQGRPIPRLLARIRRLLRLDDDRELRQLPAAAQSIDAVRLLTVHGSKGLEFPVVHLPGMNVNTLPRAYRTSPCPPPPGMIAGAAADPAIELKQAHEEEQQCLFYVALSRARDRLFLYAETRDKRGSRTLSSFVGLCGNAIEQFAIQPTLRLPEPADHKLLDIDVSDVTFEASKIALYRRCPRRFLYTHVLKLGGRRDDTPFMRLHEAVRQIVEAIAGGEDLSDDAIMARIEAECSLQGLDDHGYVEEYRAFGAAMAKFFLSCRDGYRRAERPVLRLSLDGGEIIVTPDELLTDSTGTPVLRRIRTGHRPSDAEDDLESAALLLAARQFIPGARVELLYLADAKLEPGDLSPRKLDTRRQWIERCLAGINQGSFPMTDKTHGCPGCPHLFNCEAVPEGSLIIFA